jgi:hypothetical protein
MLGKRLGKMKDLPQLAVHQVIPNKPAEDRNKIFDFYNYFLHLFLCHTGVKRYDLELIDQIADDIV